MKRINIFMAALAALSALASCDNKEPDERIEPVFPDAMNRTVEPGEEVTITFDANLDWEVSVPETTIKSFWIMDGAFSSYKVSGKAGKDIKVTVGVSETESFEEMSCDVTLSMGDESRVIATLVRSAKQAFLTVNVAQVADGEIQYLEDGSDYLYHEDEAESIDLIWTGSDFRLPIKVTANCNWTYEAPEWVSIDVPEKGNGTVKINVTGVPSEYPLQAESGKIRFKTGNTIIKEYGISIPGCEDIFSYSVGMALSEIVFNYEGRIKTVAGFIDGPATVSVSGTSGVEVFAVECVDGRYMVEDASASEWLNVGIEPYDSSEGADVLQTRTVELSVILNEGEDRHAAVFFMPPTGWNTKEELFNDTFDSVREEFVQYMLPVSQLSINQEFIIMLSAPSEMAENGASFDVTSDSGLFTKFGETRFAYDLFYTDRYASDYARMYFSAPVASYKIYDAAGKDMTDSEDFFLKFEQDDNMNGGLIRMESDSKAAGYVVLLGSSGNVLAVVRCILDPEKVIGEVADVTFLGESEMYAPLVGATLVHVTEGPVYDQYMEYGVPVYHLTYTKENEPLLISIPASIKSYLPNPWALIDNFRVNDLDFDDGSFDRIDGGIRIYMIMPEGRDKMTGNIMFYNSKSPDNEKLALVLACTMDLSADSAE